MQEPISAYLNTCQPLFKTGLDAFDASTPEGIIKTVIAAIKQTPWYLDSWEQIDEESWF